MVCRYGARPLYWFNWLISPFITLGDWIAKGTLKLFGVEMTGAGLETEEDVLETRAQLRNRLGSLLEEGELPEECREEVLNALDADELSISEGMVTAEDIVSLSTTATIQENFETIRNTPHTRFPLVGEELTDFHGIVYAPSILDNSSWATAMKSMSPSRTLGVVWTSVERRVLNHVELVDKSPPRRTCGRCRDRPR